MNKSQLIIKKTGESGNDTDMSKEKKNANIRSGNDDLQYADQMVGADIYDNAELYSSVCLIDIPYHLDRLFDYKVPGNLGELSGGETLCGFHLVRETVSISRL